MNSEREFTLHVLNTVIGVATDLTKEQARSIVMSMTVPGVASTGYGSRIDMHSGGRPRSVAGAVPVDLHEVARAIGVPVDALRAFVLGGVRLSVASTGSNALDSASSAFQQAKVPMTSGGLPDFDAIVAAGGSVKGAIPPDGSPMVQNVNQYGNVIEYAAIVDLGDGSPPFLLKGGDAQAASTASAGNREQLLSVLQYVLAELPKNLEQAQQWSEANNWPIFDQKTPPNTRQRLDAIL